MYRFFGPDTERMMPVYRAGRFANHPDEQKKAFVLPSLIAYVQLMMRSSKQSRAAARAWHSLELPAHTLSDDQQRHPAAPAITWLGHASFLLEFVSGGRLPVRILVDPVFGDLTWLLPRYATAAPIREELPVIDYVLISHNHWDHLEKDTIIYLQRFCNPLFLVPHGDARWLHAWGAQRVREHSWWDQYAAPELPDLRCTFLPAYHWSKRGLFDDNRSLWGSWMIEYGGYTTYFAGDTAYANHFKVIASEFSSIDTVLMPIGPCEPRAKLRQSHISPEEAGLAFLDLNARTLIPMHWGTYGFGVDDPLVPLERMHTWWNGMIPAPAGGGGERLFCPLRIGHTIHI